jgi:hypothetical protein
MIELRWVTFGPNRQLEYRTREFVVDNWGNIRRATEKWSDWKIAPSIDGNEAAMEDLIASGGIVGSSS